MTQALPEPRLFAASEARLAPLDALARQHWLNGIVHSQGELEPRLASLATLRAQLFAGVVAAEDWRWPAPPVASRLADVLLDLELASYCHARQELTDTVLMSVLFHLDFIVDYADRGAGDAGAIAMAIDAFRADWEERCGQMDEWVEVFGMLPDDGKSIDWDQLKGVLRSSGWQAVLRTRRWLARLPDLQRVVQRLGRSRESNDDDALQKKVEIVTEAMAFAPTARDLRIPDLPGETRGVCRSDRFVRMLPSEVMALQHPRLRLVWHARRAERSLLTYEDDDRMQERRIRRTVVTTTTSGQRKEKRREAGPIIVCVDTSGSMRGGAETVAKATVLEALRTAQAQGRACHVFAFGGPDEVVEMELGTDVKGLRQLTDFIGTTFGGGTELSGPIDRALKKIETETWKRADVLIASDGEFGVTAELAQRVSAAKSELGLRVQGILVGDRETIGMLALAEDILHVRDWRRYSDLGQGADAPIPDQRLTALLFPGALRSVPTVDAGIAAASVSGGKALP